jgi:hypothetical protein
MLPNNWIIKRIRVDRGGFNQDNMEQWEHDCIEYFVKVKMNNSVRKIINYVNANSSQYPWQEIDSIFAVTEITVPLPAWQKARRFILIRKKLLEAPNDQLHLDGDWFRYEYQVIVTNNGYLTRKKFLLNTTSVFLLIKLLAYSPQLPD